jgi:tRNA (cmo5U34)-methyltransferase
MFTDPQTVANYTSGPPRLVPGFADLHKMAGVLMAESCPPDARILVLGAGGGLEMAALAKTYPGWTFDGVDPSAAMLDLAHQTLGTDAHRATLHQGYIEEAPIGPFDAAICLLTLHFVPYDDKLRTLRDLHRRLSPAAPYVSAHHSIVADPDQRIKWLTRCFDYAGSVAAGDPLANARMMAEKLPILSPDEDAATITAAGFHDVALFYAAFTFRGWVGYA